MHDTKRLGWHGSAGLRRRGSALAANRSASAGGGHVHRLTSAAVISVLVDHFGGLGFSEHPAAEIGLILGRALMVISIGPVSLFSPDGGTRAAPALFQDSPTDSVREEGKISDCGR
jgi:hypothetical protein